MNEPTLQRTDFYDDGTTTTETVDPPDGTTASDWVTTLPFLSIEEATPLVRLHIIDGFEIHLAKPMPRRWWRFWQRALLGWRWEAASDD